MADDNLSQLHDLVNDEVRNRVNEVVEALKDRLLEVLASFDTSVALPAERQASRRNGPPAKRLHASRVKRTRMPFLPMEEVGPLWPIEGARADYLWAPELQRVVWRKNDQECRPLRRVGNGLIRLRREDEKFSTYSRIVVTDDSGDKVHLTKFPRAR